MCIRDRRDNGGALVGFQDIHSLAFLRGRPEHASCPQVPTVSALRPCPRSIQVGEFEVAISGGIWVAIREAQLASLASCDWIRRQQNLIIQGATGVGLSLIHI